MYEPAIFYNLRGPDFFVLSDLIMSWESWLRLGSFGGLLVAMVIWETLAPRRRELREKRSVHGVRNLALSALNAVVIRLLVPVLPAGLAVMAASRGWGLLNQISLPTWFATLLALLLLDLAIYGQHVVFHRVPVLWRLHKVHHTDLDFDVTTAIRFHPIEILLSLAIKSGLVFVLGPSATAVILFEIILNATAMFNHSNILLPLSMDRWLRLVLVTPDMHRIHHSVLSEETNSNYGFNLPWWDRLLRTYRAQPREDHKTMAIGLQEYRNAARLSLLTLVAIPFQSPSVAPDPASENRTNL